MNSPGHNASATETRDLLLDSAAREIHVRGFQAASVSRILAETGVTKGALYHHFASKLELGYAVLDERFAPLIRRQWIEPMVVSSGDPIARLISIVREAGSRMSDEDVALGCPINNLAQEMSPVDAGFRHRIEGLLDEWRQSIERALRRAGTDGLVVADMDPKSTAVFVVAALEGCVGMAKNAQSRDLLMRCGQGLILYLERLRVKPGKKSDE